MFFVVLESLWQLRPGATYPAVILFLNNVTKVRKNSETAKHFRHFFQNIYLTGGQTPCEVSTTESLKSYAGAGYCRIPGGYSEISGGYQSRIGEALQ